MKFVVPSVMNPFILLSLIAGALGVDNRAGWQSLLAQPVFAALLVGLVTGQVSVALPVGLILEFAWLSILPMRGSRRPDQVVGVITGAGTAAIIVQFTGDPRTLMVSAVGVFVGLVSGELSRPISETLFKAQSEFLSRVKFERDADRTGIVRKLAWLHTGSIAYIFLVEAIVAFVFLTICYGMAEWFVIHATDYFVDGSTRWNSLMPVLGAAAVIHLYWRPQAKRVLLVIGVLTMLVLWLN